MRWVRGWIRLLVVATGLLILVGNASPMWQVAGCAARTCPLPAVAGVGAAPIFFQGDSSGYETCRALDGGVGSIDGGVGAWRERAVPEHVRTFYSQVGLLALPPVFPGDWVVVVPRVALDFQAEGTSNCEAAQIFDVGRLVIGGSQILRDPQMRWLAGGSELTFHLSVTVLDGPGRDTEALSGQLLQSIGACADAAGFTAIDEALAVGPGQDPLQTIIALDQVKTCVANAVTAINTFAGERCCSPPPTLEAGQCWMAPGAIPAGHPRRNEMNAGLVGRMTCVDPYGEPDCAPTPEWPNIHTWALWRDTRLGRFTTAAASPSWLSARTVYRDSRQPPQFVQGRVFELFACLELKRTNRDAECPNRPYRAAAIRYEPQLGLCDEAVVRPEGAPRSKDAEEFTILPGDGTRIDLWWEFKNLNTFNDIRRWLDRRKACEEELRVGPQGHAYSRTTMALNLVGRPTIVRYLFAQRPPVWAQLVLRTVPGWVSGVGHLGQYVLARFEDTFVEVPLALTLDGWVEAPSSCADDCAD